MLWVCGPSGARAGDGLGHSDCFPLDCSQPRSPATKKSTNVDHDEGARSVKAAEWSVRPRGERGPERTLGRDCYTSERRPVSPRKLRGRSPRHRSPRNPSSLTGWTRSVEPEDDPGGNQELHARCGPVLRDARGAHRIERPHHFPKQREALRNHVEPFRHDPEHMPGRVEDARH